VINALISLSQMVPLVHRRIDPSVRLFLCPSAATDPELEPSCFDRVWMFHKITLNCIYSDTNLAIENETVQELQRLVTDVESLVFQQIHQYRYVVYHHRTFFILFSRLSAFIHSFTHVFKIKIISITIDSSTSH